MDDKGTSVNLTPHFCGIAYRFTPKIRRAKLTIFNFTRLSARFLQVVFVWFLPFFPPSFPRVSVSGSVLVSDKTAFRPRRD